MGEHADRARRATEPKSASGDLAVQFAAASTDLRAMAAALLRRERASHTLQPTALVNEAYLRMQGRADLHGLSRTSLMSVSAASMRRLLIDHARRRAAAKRGGGERLRLVDEIGLIERDDVDDVDAIDLDDALRRLAELDERQARVVELRFFGGLDVDQVALTLDVSARTVKNDWRVARAWLRAHLARDESMPGE